MPSVALVNKYSLESRPHHLALNCNTTLLSVIDVTGLLQFVDLGENKMEQSCHEYFEPNSTILYSVCVDSEVTNIIRY